MASERGRSVAAFGSGKLRCKEEEGFARGRCAEQRHGLAGCGIPVS